MITFSAKYDKLTHFPGENLNFLLKCINLSIFLCIFLKLDPMCSMDQVTSNTALHTFSTNQHQVQRPGDSWPSSSASPN